MPEAKPLKKLVGYADLMALEQRWSTAAQEGTLGTQSTQARLGTQSPDDGQLAAVLEVPGRPKWKDHREQLNLKLPQDLLERLRRFAFDNRIPVTTAVIQGIQLLLGTQSTQARLGTHGRNLPSSDLDDDNDDQTIADFYEKATGNVFNERDREFLGKYRQLGVQCLTLAIATGRNRSRAKINSMKFFENNIKEAAALQPDKIERELAFQLVRFKRRVGH